LTFNFLKKGSIEGIHSIDAVSAGTDDFGLNSGMALTIQAIVLQVDLGEATKTTAIQRK